MADPKSGAKNVQDGPRASHKADCKEATEGSRIMSKGLRSHLAEAHHWPWDYLSFSNDSYYKDLKLIKYV